MEVQRGSGIYRMQRLGENSLKLLNSAGESMICRINDNGVLESDDSRARHPYVAELLQEACIGLGLCP